MAPFDDPKYRCLCGSLHVTRGARLVGIIYCFVLACSLLAGIIGGRLNVIAFFLNALSCICLLFTERIRNQWLYLPFLIVEAIGLVTLVIVEAMIILCVVFGIGKIKVVIANDPKTATNLTELGVLPLSFIIIGIAIVFALDLYFYSVVLRAWMFTRRELGTPMLPITITPSKIALIDLPPPVPEAAIPDGTNATK